MIHKKKELSFFNNALGSAGEVRHWLITALDNKYITQKQFDELDAKTV
jgi:four helix bundle protein